MLKSFLVTEVEPTWYRPDPELLKKYQRVWQVFHLLILPAVILRLMGWFGSLDWGGLPFLKYGLMPVVFWFYSFAGLQVLSDFQPGKWWLFLLASGMLNLAVTAGYFYLPVGSLRWVAVWLLSGLAIFFNLGTLFLATRSMPRDIRRLGLQSQHVVYQLLLGFVIGASLNIHFLFVIRNFVGYPVEDYLFSRDNWLLFAYLAGYVVLVRELLLRGFLYSLFSKYLSFRKWKVIGLVIVYDLILSFALYPEFGQTLRGLISWNYLMVISVLVTLFRERSENLYSGAAVQIASTWLLLSVFN